MLKIGGLLIHFDMYVIKHPQKQPVFGIPLKKRIGSCHPMRTTDF